MTPMVVTTRVRLGVSQEGVGSDARWGEDEKEKEE